MRTITLGAMGAMVLAVAAACGGPPPPPAPSPQSDLLVRRHWDQVCAPSQSPTPSTIRVEEAFDTAGVLSVVASPERRIDREGVEWLDYLVHYDRDGRPTVHGTWGFAGDTASATRLGGLLGRRVQRLPGGLLEATSLRARLTLHPRPVLAVDRDIECLPHMVHRPDARPVGLPEGVVSQGGIAWIPEGDTVTATVRLHLDATGSVRQVELRKGSPQAYEKTVEVVRLLRFDPALLNGLPVPGILVQSFRFGPLPPRPGR